jgi:hypothetical protein
VFYCGGNLSRGWAWLGGSPLAMGSGPKTRSEVGLEGRTLFSVYELGEQISRGFRGHHTYFGGGYALDGFAVSSLVFGFQLAASRCQALFLFFSLTTGVPGTPYSGVRNFYRETTPMTRYRKPAVAGLFCLGLIASAQVQARAQSEAPVAGQPSQIPAGYTILADHDPLGVCDRFGYAAKQPSPVGRRIYRVVVLVDVVVVAILAAIVISRTWFVATPGQTSRAGRPLARAGRSIDRPGPECSRCPAPARRTRVSALAPLSARPLREKAVKGVRPEWR